MKFAENINSLKIVPMCETHCDMVSYISKNEFVESWSLKSIISEIDNKYALTLVATLNQEVVGFINGRVIFEQAYINNIAIMKEYQRNGIGQKLLIEFITSDKLKNVSEVTLEVRESNKSAILFYETNGFNKIVSRKGYYQNPLEDGFTMIHYIDERKL